MATFYFLFLFLLCAFSNVSVQRQLDDWSEKIMTHTYIHENLVSMMKTFRYDAHPMVFFLSFSLSHFLLNLNNLTLICVGYAYQFSSCTWYFLPRG